MTRRINKIVIHCSDSNFGDIKLIESWHKDRGFKSIGYHFVITNGCILSTANYDPNMDGRIQNGRDVQEVGAHAMGFNLDSIGICLVGKTKFSTKQLTTLLSLIRVLMVQFPTISISRIVGHNELTKQKTCPNFNVQIIRDLVGVFSDFTVEH